MTGSTLADSGSGTPFPGSVAGTIGDNLLNATSALDITGYVEIGAFRFDALIQALASAGLANVLAQPTLTALSGEEASFHAGGEIPVLSGEKDGRLEYTYRELGVILGFVPTVISEDRIGISVRAEVKEEDESRTTNPLFAVRGRPQGPHHRGGRQRGVLRHRGAVQHRQRAERVGRPVAERICRRSACCSGRPWRARRSAS